MNLGMNHAQHVLNLIIWQGLQKENAKVQDQKIPSVWISSFTKIISQTFSWRWILKHGKRHIIHATDPQLAHLSKAKSWYIEKVPVLH